MLEPWAIFSKGGISKPVIKVNYTCFCVPKIETAIVIVAWSSLWRFFTLHLNCNLLHWAQGTPDLLIPIKQRLNETKIAEQ